MALILTILVALPLGWLLRNQLVAYVAFLAAHSFVFTFQTGWLLLDWSGGDPAAFGPYPDYSVSSTFGYAAVNLVFLVAGLGLVHVGHRLAARRRAKATAAVRLDPAVS